MPSNGARSRGPGIVLLLHPASAGPGLSQWSPALETGKRDRSVVFDVSSLMPQWSPALETGKSRRLGQCGSPDGRASMEPGLGDREETPPRRAGDCAAPASMEPGLGDREEVPVRARRTPGRRGLNGARPWRPGRAGSPRRPTAPPRCLNGARPWRPGREEDIERGSLGLQASMEPGLGDREEREFSVDIGLFNQPQWSPALETGKRGPRAHRRATNSLPQWSPALETGKSGG